MAATKTKRAKKELGRIWFAKNPWPKGHAIKAATWSGRLDPERGLVFDLHLESADYYAEVDVESDDLDAPSWDAPAVWGNYHSCSLSSTMWQHRGFVVGTSKKPLAWSALSDHTFRVDPAKSELPEGMRLVHERLAQAFGIYLLGHDAVADHRITFTRAKAAWSLDWTAKIALAYVGHTALRHRMRAEIRGLAFRGFDIPKGMTAKDAEALFATLVTDPKRWTIEKRRFVRA